MNTPRIAPALLLLAASSWLPATVLASGPVPLKTAQATAQPAAHAAQAAPAGTTSAPAGAATAQGGAGAAASDPMEHLRKRLAERLGGRQASAGATSAQDIRVSAKAAPSSPAPATASPAPVHANTPAKTATASTPAHLAPAGSAAGHAAAAVAAPASPPAQAAALTKAHAGVPAKASAAAPTATHAAVIAAAHAPVQAQAPTARQPAKTHAGPGATASVVPVAAHLVLPPVLRAEPAPAAHAPAAPRPARPKAASATALTHAAASHASTTQGHSAHWDYSGPAGPQTWGGLRPEFNLCGTGQRQSPIDVRGGLAVDLEPVRFDYQSSRFSVIDNGHTVQVNMAPGNAIHLGGKRFDLQQFHFHRPSEDRIDGRQFEMSAHLVHKDDQGRLAVVTILLDKGPAQPAVQKVWNNLPLEKNEDVPARVSLDVNELLPADQRYYTYMGSLTTPPCTEGVQWVIMRQPVTMSPEQIELFSRIYPMNARPVQQIAGRRILQSN